MYLDPNGIAVIEETDPITPFQTLLNSMQSATSNKVAALDGKFPQIQYGSVNISMGGQASATAQVTFPTAFTGSGLPMVMATYGSSNSVPTLIPGAYNITNTGFTALFVIGDRSTHTGTRTLNWLAIKA